MSNPPFASRHPQKSGRRSGDFGLSGEQQHVATWAQQAMPHGTPTTLGKPADSGVKVADATGQTPRINARHASSLTVKADRRITKVSTNVAH